MDDIHVLAERPRVADSDVLRHFRAFKIPHHDFDLYKASERELLVHGLPQRPNRETHPRLAAKWERIVAQQRFHYITPELKVMPMLRRSVDVDLLTRRSLFDHEFTRYRDKLSLKMSSERLRDILKLLALVPETSTNWSGAYVKRPASEQIVTVTGEWRVPGINPPASAWNGTGYNDGTYLCVCWVGIDGTQGSNDVMQAGTGSQCVVSGGKMVSTSFFAWTEWFSLPWINITNFPVQVGDIISCTVCAPFGNSHGTAMFNNLTQNTTTNVGIDPPSGTTLVGNVAEWIVEDPGQAGGGLFPFPNYGSTFFNDCTAGTKNIELDLGTAREIDLVDVANNVISSGSIENNRTRRWCRSAAAPIVCGIGSIASSTRCPARWRTCRLQPSSSTRSGASRDTVRVACSVRAASTPGGAKSGWRKSRKRPSGKRLRRYPRSKIPDKWPAADPPQSTISNGMGIIAKFSSVGAMPKILAFSST